MYSYNYHSLLYIVKINYKKEVYLRQQKMKKQGSTNNNGSLKQTSCPQCKASVPSKDIRQHILTCRKYVPTYLHNVRRFMDQMTPNYRQFLIAQMDLIQQQLRASVRKSNGQIQIQPSFKYLEAKYSSNSIRSERKVEIKQNKPQNHTNIQQQSLVKKQNIPIKREEIIVRPPIEHTMQLQDLFQPFIKPEQNQHIECADPTCNRPVNTNDIQNYTYLDQCLHTICKYCFRTYVRNNFVKSQGELKCPNKKCSALIPLIQIQQIVDKSVFAKLQNELNTKILGDLIECQKCHQQYHFQKGKPSDAPKTTQQGKKMTASNSKHYAENRFQCAKCKSDQCKTCKAVPYHLGFNCQDYQQHKLKKKCRYCQQVLPKGYMSQTGIRTFDDICQSSDCVAQMREACSKKLACGHSCFGIIKQKNCLPCLKESCAKSKSQVLLGQDQGSYCSLCYIQSLAEAPCIKSKCGHIFHLKCLKKRLDLKWISPRINFRFCQCPLCNSWIELPSQCDLSKSLQNFKALSKKIQQKALKRLVHQGHQKDEKVTDSHSEYYNNPTKYAKAIYAYFQCYECHEPYFGGRKNCAQAMNQANQGQKFNPKELICPSCCPVQQLTECKKHGKDFISFKCRFCCSVAQWFCWGNTHFCDSCHKRQISGEYISRTPKQKLPKCQGKGKCPVGGEHGENGDDYCLGCGICRGDRIEAQYF